jgi:uncharacterized protein (TIGR02099 family)
VRASLIFLRRLAKRLLISLLALVALANLLAFLLTPLLDHYRDDLAGLASELLGRPVAIGGMQARWHGYGPEVVLEDLRIGDGAGAIELAEAAVDLGLWDMLRYRDISPLRVTLRHLEIHLIRDPAGRLFLAGFEGLAPGRAGGVQAETLPLSGRLRLEDVTVLWEDQRLKLPVRRLENARLRLHLWPDRLSMSASVNLPGSRTGRLRAAAELDLDGQDWSGEVYLAGRLPEAAAQLGPYLPEPLRVTRGGVEFKVWSDWESSRLATMEGQFAIDRLYLDRGIDTPALDLDSASAEFRYRRVGEQRQLDLARLTLSRDGHSWPVTGLHLGLNLATAGHPDLRLSAEYLRLADLLAITRPIRLPPALAELRDGLAPDAILRELRFRLEPGEGPPRWQLSTDFSALDSRAWRHYPGVTGLSGRLQGDQQRLALQVQGEHVRADLPTLFRAPLPITRLRGQLSWQSREDGWELAGEQLTLDTPDFQSLTRLRLSQSPEEGLRIDLQADVSNGESSNAGRYYPVHIMEPQLVAWLDRAIGPGRLPKGSVRMHGPLRDFPFDKRQSGDFEVRFDAAELRLDYLPEWPALQLDDAEVVFHNNSLDIRLQQGRIYDSLVLPTHARIASLAPASPLEIRGEIQGPLADPLRLLAESPLKARFGELARGLQARGQSRLALDFAVVLGKLGRDRLAGSLELQRAGLRLPAWDLELNEAVGQLDFDLDGVRGKDVRAKVLDSPVRIDVSPAADGAEVQASAHIGIPALKTRFPDLGKVLPEGLVAGETDLHLALQIPRHPRPGGQQPMRVSSNLIGIEVALPEPLGKGAEQPRPLTLSVPLNGGQAPFLLSYGDLLSAAFRPGADRLAIRLGGAPARLPDQAVLSVSGRLEQLALEPWLKLAAARGEGMTLPPLVTDLEIGRLGLGRFTLDDVRVALQQTASGWQGSAQAVDFAGRFDIPAKAAGRPAAVDLDRLNLTMAPDSPEDGGTQARMDTGRPADWPDLDLNVSRLQVNKQDLGQLTLNVRHRDNGLVVQPIRLAGPVLSFEGDAYWRGDGQQRSGLNGTLKAPRLGKVLDALGYAPQFSGAPTTATIGLNWPGSPADLAAAQLQGTVDLSIGAGQLLEVDPGVARVFGLLNFRALQRRLRLDFSDLFKKGLSFDTIKGRFRLVDGVSITGRTGLATRDLYQEVTVAARLDATLPVAGAFAAGPWAGVAVLLAQQVVKDKVDNFNTVRYQVSGSWDDPRVEQLGKDRELPRLLRPGSAVEPVPGAQPGEPADTPGTAK